jgi:hypothetical protein
LPDPPLDIVPHWAHRLQRLSCGIGQRPVHTVNALRDGANG